MAWTLGADLSKGYFDAGDYVKYGQPAAYTMSILAWSGQIFAAPLRDVGALDELKLAVRWGVDFILAAASQLDATTCTFAAPGQARSRARLPPRRMQIRSRLLGSARGLYGRLSVRPSAQDVHVINAHESGHRDLGVGERGLGGGARPAA